MCEGAIASRETCVFKEAKARAVLGRADAQAVGFHAYVVGAWFSENIIFDDKQLYYVSCARHNTFLYSNSLRLKSTILLLK